MKTRILPTVGEKYISRNDGVVVEVWDVWKAPATGESIVSFRYSNDSEEVGYYGLDKFWANYKVMEGEDGP